MSVCPRGGGLVRVSLVPGSFREHKVSLVSATFQGVGGRVSRGAEACIQGGGYPGGSRVSGGRVSREG